MEFSEFILLHDADDVASLALQRKRLGADVPDWDLALSTLQARRKLRTKLPSWHALPSLHYPLPLSAEQCSSEETACYKASLLSHFANLSTKNALSVDGLGEMPTCPPKHPISVDGLGEMPTCPPKHPVSVDGLRVADLTGGLGVDAWAFSQVCEKVLYNEMKPELVEAARHNFKELGVKNVEIRSSVVVPGKVKEILSGFEPDVIFLDPARRDDVGRKVFMLEDCSPNVLELLPELYEASPKIMLKLSPMADITAVCKQLTGVKEVHVVEAGGECKELLLVMEKGYEGEYELYLYANGAVAQISRLEKRMTEELGNMLYVPGKGLMKTGAFWWPETFGLRQMAASTHVYVGSGEVQELKPFGKFYSIVESAPLNGRSIKEFGKKYPEADVTARNIPITSDELRKRLGVRPSDGSTHIFGLQSDSDGRILVVGVISK